MVEYKMNERHDEIVDWLQIINNNVVTVAKIMRTEDNSGIKNNDKSTNNVLKDENDRLRRENKNLLESQIV